MSEHLFLCGLSQEQRAKCEPGRDLQLHGPDTNVTLKLDDIRRRLIRVEPELLTDFLEIAAYVFAADNLVRRGGPVFSGVGKDWRRHFQLAIAVRRPGQWRSPGMMFALRGVLQFLSDDAWDFEFVELQNPPRIGGYLNFAAADADRPGDTTIVMFSGGLDSFAGAVHELQHSNRHVVLMSRRLTGMTDQRQVELAGELQKLYPRRVTHVPVSAGMKAQTSAVEHTQRTRSFLLTAIALVAAVMEKSDRIRFYENGIMSVNLPISTQVVGTRASRSTHPRSLALLENLTQLVQDDEIKVDNPFIWKTKAEVVQELQKTVARGLTRRTLSCSRTRQMTKYKPHCGTCAQCLQRRISTLGAGAADADPEEGYAIEMLLGQRQDGEDRMMAVDTVRSALEFCRLSDADFAIEYAGEFAWLTTGFPGTAPADVARAFVEMFRRHGEAVRAIFVRAAEDQAGALIDHSLPDSCLLQLMVNIPGMEAENAPIVATRTPDVPEESLPVDGEYLETPEFVLAVDQGIKWILIDGIAPITGSTSFLIMSRLVERYREDQASGRLPINYRAYPVEELVDLSGLTDAAALRQAITRIRMDLREGFVLLYGTEPDKNAVIENVRGKGYRINPKVRVVAPDEIARR